jgi:hypothetical protein
MTATAEIPVAVSDEATALVAELGLQREYEMMLAHTRQSVPRLRSVAVTRYDDPENVDEPRVVITAWYTAVPPEDISVWDEWGRWFVETFPPDVCRHFGFSTRVQGDHGR